VNGPDAGSGAGWTWTLHRRVGLLCVVIALFGVATAAAAALALGSLTSAREEIIEEIDLARVAGLEAYAALATQESAVRGFALSGQPRFLEPYEMGGEEAGDALSRLEQLVEGTPTLLAAAGEVRRRIEVWERGAADPTIEAARRGATRPEPGVLAEGQVLFDGVRDGFSLLERELDRSRASAQRRLDAALERFVAVLAVGISGFVLLAGVSFFLLRHWITKPTQQLADDTRKVAAGALDHVVKPAGPPELASLGRDIEAMRKRITDELAAVEAAKQTLDQRFELERSNAELEQFAYVASHDLQEPLRKVASFCQLIEKRYSDQLDDRGRQYIDFAVDGAKRMQALINDLLSFSRVGRTTERFRPVDLDEVAANALASLEPVIEESGATVTIHPLPTVSGDPSLLNAVFQNLIGNAIKFRSEDAPVVELGAERQDDHWVLRVTDNGIGIPDQYAERIFVIFQRLHAREAYEGTGIGLSLCRKIVEFHGGRIAIDKGRASGTSVTFTLPVLEPPSDAGSGPEVGPLSEPAPQEAALP
jgi:signal transduction histidine kinase